MKIQNANGKNIEACAVIECNGYLLSLSTVFRANGPGELRVFRAKLNADGIREDLTSLIWPGNPSASAENIAIALRHAEIGRFDDPEKPL